MGNCKEENKMKKQEIKQKIVSIKSSLEDGNYSDEKYKDILRDSFKGETCYILGCGPSFLDIEPEKLGQVLNENLTVTIKQACSIIGSVSDIQLFNCCNVSRYHPEPETLFVGQTDGLTVERARRHWGDQEVNLAFNVANNNNPKNTLAANLDFDNWTLENSWHQRPFGPGIMYETVLFFVKHLGVSKIRTIGWDFQDPKQEKSWVHFYPESNRGQLKNPSNLPYSSEVQDSINLSKHFFLWLKKSGVSLEVMKSDKCYVHEEITRYSL